MGNSTSEPSRASADLFIGSLVDDAGLDPYEFRVLCRVSRRGQCTESMDNMAESLHIGINRLRAAISSLKDKGWIDRINTGKGLVLTVRVNRSADSESTDQLIQKGESQRISRARVNRSVDSESTDQWNKGTPSNETLLRTTGEELVKMWNSVDGFAKSRKMTQGRLKVLRQRIKDPDWVEHWQEALERISQSDFCTGNGDQGWRANIDWFLKPDTINAICEGKYDNRKPQREREKKIPILT